MVKANLLSYTAAGASYSKRSEWHRVAHLLTCLRSEGLIVHVFHDFRVNSAGLEASKAFLGSFLSVAWH